MKQIRLLIILLIVGIVVVLLWTLTISGNESKQKREKISLPLDLKIEYWGADVQYPVIGLVIEDELGLVVLGKESKFLINDDTIQVEKIKRIGFNDFRLVAEVEDTKDGVFYIECSQNNHITSTNDLNISVWNSIDMIEPDSLQWIDATEISP